ncbi:MAG: hypothetical protein KJ798_13475 [Gammaproteobacteria bacterium]|uniref:hypothetical protein n=1 Tax=Limnobacter sp. TaxID=2003368 RepID=UPI001D774560|nr:hypothetical protein [Limnobacter sp.]MBU0785005.1 hypothetical protein [Gammaproteobacteria bacterium]MBU0849044.1 hypothetical protein [Gammaproteobacteria bacterium]MBU1266664.1 hypothetical protein [Gammaproteobacteria bacterium]MBU1529870.1 hypothetical protein [Gammaproteobacteria bacterium]MBU1781381.1 hypothetical protein [Gammaproteobacteria bacterium]
MGMKGMGALQRRVSLPHVSALALCLAALWSTPLQANGFENFEDAELIDHIAGSVSRDYGQMYGYEVGFKLIGKEVLHHSALLVQYNAHQKHCTFLLSTRDRNWYNFRQYMKFFKELPKKVVYEAFFAHESGHCVQKKEKIDLGSVQRRHREELFADLFALSHIERHFPEHRHAFEEALLDMRRAAYGIQKDYGFYKELLKFQHSPDLHTALKVINPQERAHSIAKVIDLL